MISADTDNAGRRIYRLPKALADVAVELFPGLDQCHAVFSMAKALSWHDAHTIENIALNGCHADAVAFAKGKIKSR